jgi:hypothetical protein
MKAAPVRGGFFVWLGSMSLLGFLFRGSKSTATKGGELKARQVLTSLRSYPVEAVGESYYQDNLVKICGPYSRDGHLVELKANLVPEPNNEFDKNAIAVKISGMKVGYLDREQAKRVSAFMLENSVSFLKVDAEIKGGWRTNQHDEGAYGVKLKFPKRGKIELK